MILARRLALSLLALFASDQLLQAAPTIRNLTPRGLTSGSTTRLVIDGAGISAETRLLVPFPVVKQEPQAGATEKRITLDVELDQVPPGIYPLRIANESGVSQAIAITVDNLPLMPFSPETKQLPVSLYGNLSGSQVLSTQFPGRKGERIVVDLVSRRLGGRLNPLLHLYDARGVQVAWSQAIDALSGDARIVATLPADQTYTAEFHDALYRGSNPGHFQLKLGALQFADLTLPLAVQRGRPSQLELIGLGGDTATVAVQAADRLGPYAVTLPHEGRFAGRQPSYLVTDVREFVEPADGDGPHEAGPVPVGLSGRLGAAGEQDVYQIGVNGGATLRLDVIADRAGSPLDGVLTVRTADRRTLKKLDDRTGMVDPGFDVKVPDKTEKLLVGIQDLLGRGGPEFVYRIAVTPAKTRSFTLETESDRLQIGADGATLLKVVAERQQYNGPIRLAFDSLPQGVEVAGAEIPSGATEALVTLTAPGGRPQQLLTALNGLGTAEGNDFPGLVKVGGALQQSEPWRQNQMALALVGPGRLRVAWQQLDASAKLHRPSRLPAAIKLTRAAGAEGKVRLSLLTTQKVPQKKVKRDNKDVMVDDVARAVRLDQPTTLESGQIEARFNILVPVDLPKLPYDVAVKAELLSADGKQVLATGTTPALRLPTEDLRFAEPLVIWEDDANIVAQLTEGKGEATLDKENRHHGDAALKVTGQRRGAAKLGELAVPIRQFPGSGEYRFVRFAWKKQGGQAVCLELAHDGKFGPEGDKAPSFRYHAGPAANCFGASVAVDKKLPGEWTVVTGDLYRDFGEFTLTGISLAPVDGDHALFDRIRLGRTPADFDRQPAK